MTHNEKHLLIITGCAGSGKTILGKELAKRLGYAFIDKDTVTGDLTDYALMQSGSYKGDRESGIYKTEIIPLEYKTILRLSKEILECGSNVVLVVPFVSAIRDFAQWEKMKAEGGLPDDIKIHFVWIEHDPKREKANIIDRNSVRDNYKLAHWDEYTSSLDDIVPDPAYRAFIFNSSCMNVVDILRWASFH